MLDYLVFYFPYLALALIGLVALVKIGVFIKYKTKKDSWANLFYYPFYNVELSSNASKKSIKKMQNYLSVLITILLALCLVFRVLIKG